MGNAFKNAREQSGYKQIEVAKEVCVKQSTVSMWETGRSRPRPDTLTRLAELYGRTTDELLGPRGRPVAEQAT